MKKEEIQLRAKIEAELERKYKEDYVPRKEFEELKSRSFKFRPPECPECGYEYPPMKVQPKEKEANKKKEP